MREYVCQMIDRLRTAREGTDATRVSEHDGPANSSVTNDLAKEAIRLAHLSCALHMAERAQMIAADESPDETPRELLAIFEEVPR